VPAIIHAEIWPSLIKVLPVAGQVKDQTQVVRLAEELRDRDRMDSLRELFAVGGAWRAAEEGWILGVAASLADRPTSLELVSVRGKLAPMEPSERLDLAREQASRAQVAAFEPEDWAELAIWAFYALENAVITAADQLQLPWEKSHPSKVKVSRSLHGAHGLPDASSLLIELNELRKSEAYGEVQPSRSMTAEEIVIAVEGYIEAVGQLVEGEDS